MLLLTRLIQQASTEQKAIERFQSAKNCFRRMYSTTSIAAAAQEQQQHSSSATWSHDSDVALLDFLRAFARHIDHRKTETLKRLSQLSAAATDLRTDLARTSTAITLLSDERFLEKVGAAMRASSHEQRSQFSVTNSGRS